MKTGKSLHAFSIFRNFLSRIVSKEFLIFFVLLSVKWGILACDDAE